MILDRPLAAAEILEAYATNKDGWDGWADNHIDFKVGPAYAELHSSYLGFRTVYSVQVKKKKRGMGHGRRLMDVIIAYAEATGCGLNLSVWVSNEAAVRLYTSVGFRITGTKSGIHYMSRYPTRIPSTPEWDQHFEDKAHRLECDHEPAPEGPDEWNEPREAVFAAEKVAKQAIEGRERFTGSGNYQANTRRLYRDAFGAALLESGWTITRTNLHDNEKEN